MAHIIHILSPRWVQAWTRCLNRRLPQSNNKECVFRFNGDRFRLNLEFMRYVLLILNVVFEHLRTKWCRIIMELCKTLVLNQKRCNFTNRNKCGPVWTSPEDSGAPGRKISRVRDYAARTPKCKHCLGICFWEWQLSYARWPQGQGQQGGHTKGQ